MTLQPLSLDDAQSLDRVARFAAQITAAMAIQASAWHALNDRDEDAPAPVTVISGPVPGLRLDLLTGDTVAHAYPTSPYGWTVHVWVVDTHGDPILARLALHTAETTAEPTAVRHVSLAHIDHATDDDGTDKTIIALHHSTLMDVLRRVRFDAGFAPLLTASPGLHLAGAGGAVPYIADGTFHGHPWALRYRYGQVTLRVAAPGRDPYETPYWHASTDYGDPRAGSLTPFEAARLLARIFPALTRAPFEYEIQVTHAATGEVLYDRVTAPGHSAADAIAMLRANWGTSAFAPLTAPAVDEVAFTLLTDDDRVFPDPAPDFTTVGTP